MDKTSSMLKLLRELVHEKHGLVADTMLYYGKRYGMNYGVSLHVIRDVARREGVDHTLSKYLYRQQIREMQLLAISMADATLMTEGEELEYWARGLINSELCEEFALRVMPRVTNFWGIFAKWVGGDNELLRYCALMAGARVTVENAVRVVEQIAIFDYSAQMDSYMSNAVVQLLANVASVDTQLVQNFLISLPQNQTCDYIRSEVEWRLEE